MIKCGFHRNKSGHCLSDDGTYCIVCNRKAGDNGEEN